MNNGKVDRILAFNHDHSESQMEFYSSEELKSIFGTQKTYRFLTKLTIQILSKHLKNKTLEKLCGAIS
jgi:hypothetical protein